MHEGTATVLVVDDVPANLGLLLDALSGAGFRVLVAESAEGAIEQLAHETPDIILLDYRLPGIDGMEACRRIRARRDSADVPILFLTAVQEVDEKIRALEAGAVDYITKPIQPAEVLARVRTHLRIAHLQRELADEVAMRREAEEQLRDSLDRALLVAGADGRIHFATRLAQTLLARHFSPNPRHDLPAELLAAAIGLRQRAATRAPAETADAGSVSVRVADDIDIHLFASTGSSGLFVLELCSRGPARPSRLLGLGLTPREAEVLFWLSEGKTNAEIGIILDSSRRTIEKHVEHILQKLRVENRAGATRLAIATLGAAT